MSAPLEHYRAGDRVRLTYSFENLAVMPKAGTLGTVTETRMFTTNRLNFPVKVAWDNDPSAEGPCPMALNEIELVHEDL